MHSSCTHRSALLNPRPLGTTSYNYDAYGNPIGAAAAGYLFAGEQRDGLTGLDYLRAQYYDPTLGRFISGRCIIEIWIRRRSNGMPELQRDTHP